MIIALGSSIQTFKTIEFHNGLNILLADRHERSTDKETRNSSGKSSVVQIIHFLLGGSIAKESLFTAPELASESFWGDFRFGIVDFRVTRRVSDPKKITIIFRGPVGPRLKSSIDLFGEEVVELDDWVQWLGHMTFKLPLDVEGTLFEKSDAPTFRSMFGYFARRREDGGFTAPSQFHSRQQTGDAQIALSYLFELDWVLAREFEAARDEKKIHHLLKKHAKAKQIKNLDTVARIRAAVTVKEKEAQQLREEVSSFQVEDHYDVLVQEASTAKSRLEHLSREAAAVSSSLFHLQASLSSEAVPDGKDIARLYELAGIQLPGSVVRTFDEVKVFHQSVVENRKHHLGRELEENQTRLAEIEGEKKQNATRRTEILANLDGKGAFSDLASMQARLAEKEQEAALLRSQYTDAVQLEKTSSTIKITENNLLARLQADFSAREPILKQAVLAVAEAKEALYADRYGAFEIVATKSGPQFNVRIEGDRSGGISNMEIFCFDYALFKLVTKNLGGPGFLIHDSHLFDGVDSRQIATALEIGSSLADELEGQYIVLMNSDEYERLSFSADRSIESKLLSVVLHDTEDGGLFGFRFG